MQTIISVHMGHGTPVIISGVRHNPNRPPINHIKDGLLGLLPIRLVIFRRIDCGQSDLPVSNIDTIAIRNIGHFAGPGLATGLRMAHQRGCQPKRECKREDDGCTIGLGTN